LIPELQDRRKAMLDAPDMEPFMELSGRKTLRDAALITKARDVTLDGL